MQNNSMMKYADPVRMINTFTPRFTAWKIMAYSLSLSCSETKPIENMHTNRGCHKRGGGADAGGRGGGTELGLFGGSSLPQPQVSLKYTSKMTTLAFDWMHDLKRFVVLDNGNFSPRLWSLWHCVHTRKKCMERNKVSCGSLKLVSPDR